MYFLLFYILQLCVIDYVLFASTLSIVITSELLSTVQIVTDTICVFFQNIIAKYDLGNLRFLSVEEFKGQIYVHIRQFEENPVSTKLYPTQKGCAVTPIPFANLLKIVPDIDERIVELRTPNSREFKYSVHLGEATFCTMESGYHCINLRTYYSRDNRLMATRKGISLRLDEWDIVKSKFDEIKELSPILADAKPWDTDFKHNEAECENCIAFKRCMKY